MIILDIFEFQFLIGRLDTAMNPRYGIRVRGFQFLIGRLDTPSALAHNQSVHVRFQFLIGRLDT